MDRKSWPWKKKSSEKAATVTEVLDHQQENGKKPSYIQISFDQYSHLNGLKDEVHKYEEQVLKLEDQIKDLDSKLTTANEDITAKEILVKQHSKVAEEAVTGWEKAESEASALKTHLETVTLAKLTVEDRAAHLDGALKECMRQIRSLKEENEQKLHDVIVTKTNQMEKLRDEFESKIGEFEQELLRSAAENDALSRSLQERSNMLMRISEEKSQAESEIEHLKNNIESCEREINTLKYETHVITKELEIRNEEKNMSMRSAESANKQHLEGVKKIAKLEAECQRLRTLVRKKLPGPAALAQMKMEVESLGRDYVDHRQRRSPARPSSPLMSQISEFSLDNMQKFHKENDLLTERLLAMEEETKMLKEALAKRNTELQVSRNLCAKTANRLQTLEAQMMSKSPTKNGFEMPAEIFSRQNASNPPSMASMSEDGNEDARSIAGSLMMKKTESANQLELMDDFLMDRKSWPWKKKSSEKAATVTEVLDHQQENGKKPSYIQISFDQYSHLNGLKDEVHKYEEQVLKLEDQIKDLDSKLTTANEDITAKEVLVKQHSKVAEEAVTGWEKAESEASALKTHLETVTLAKLTVEDRAAHLDGALKECMRQIRSLKEENEQKLHDVIVTKTNQMDKLRGEFESKIGEFEQELLRSAAENDALSRSLQERSNMLMRISEEKSQAESEIEHLKNNIESCEREINTLKYETHVITKELEIRNEEKNMSMRSAESANKQHLEGVKKIAKLEAECQRLRTLVRKKLPGPAALAQMKMEVESLGRDYVDHRQRRSPARPSSPLMSPMSHMSQISEFSLDNMQKFHKENDLLTERLLAMEEETKMLKEALAKRNTELQVSRNLCAKTANRLQTLEAQMMSKSPTKSGFEMPAEIFSRQNASNPPSMASMSEDGNEDARSIAGSLMMKKTESANQLELMDDFLEMEKLACLPNNSNANGSTDQSNADSDAEIVPATQLKKRISTLLQSLPKDAAFEKILAEVQCAIEDAGGPNVNGHTEEKEIAMSNETTEEKVITQELAHALSQIYHFVSYLSKEATPCQDTFSQKVQEFSVTFDRVLSKEKTLVDFLFDLSRVLVEASELKINVLGYNASEVEIHSPDCIDKVALPENKALLLRKDSSGEHYQNGCSQSSDSEIPDCNGTSGYEPKLSAAACKFTAEEFEGLKLEKEKAETNLASCQADLEATKSKLQETEQLLAEVKSDLESAQKSNGMAETQLKCMVESYRSLETRSSELEIELSSLKCKIENLEDELHDEKENNREALTKCQELEEQLQRDKQNCPTCSVTEVDPKSKQDNELAAAAEKLQECQETILLLGKQLKSMCPQTEQVASSPSQEQTLNQEEDNEFVTTNHQDSKSSSPSDKETPSMTIMRSPVGSKHRHTKSNSSSSSSGHTPEKHSRGFSRFFSSKAK